MNRNVTAVYRSHEVADLVRRDLEGIGISRTHVHIVPDVDEPVRTSGMRDDRRWTDQLHDLHLPDDDVRTYQQCVRRGDYVVSANVEDAHLDRVREIMRRPEEEAYDLDARTADFRDEALIAHSDTARGVNDPRYLGQPDTANADPYVRSYRRDVPLGGA